MSSSTFFIDKGLMHEISYEGPLSDFFHNQRIFCGLQDWFLFNVNALFFPTPLPPRPSPFLPHFYHLPTVPGVTKPFCHFVAKDAPNNFNTFSNHLRLQQHIAGRQYVVLLLLLFLLCCKWKLMLPMLFCDKCHSQQWNYSQCCHVHVLVIVVVVQSHR